MAKPVPGARPAEVQELARAQDRLSFIYVEHCIVNRDSNAITASNQRGTVHVPASIIGALLLGPGTNVTHQAMVLLAESGATTLWVGEQGVPSPAPRACSSFRPKPSPTARRGSRLRDACTR